MVKQVPFVNVKEDTPTKYDALARAYHVYCQAGSLSSSDLDEAIPQMEELVEMLDILGVRFTLATKELRDTLNGLKHMRCVRDYFSKEHSSSES